MNIEHLIIAPFEASMCKVLFNILNSSIMLPMIFSDNYVSTLALLDLFSTLQDIKSTYCLFHSLFYAKTLNYDWLEVEGEP